MIARPSDLRHAPFFSFGDYPYGTELLELPATPSTHGRNAKLANAPKANLLFLPEVNSNPVDESLSSDVWQNPELSLLYWFRWISGHQATFLFWRALARCLVTARSRVPTEILEHAVSDAVSLTNGYSSMLLYSGSCCPELYRDVFRVFMGLHHRAFSGKWAMDYRGIPKLYGAAIEKLQKQGQSELAELLKSAYHDNHTMHAAIAQRMVPDGPSLLQQSGLSSNAPAEMAHTQQFYFDSFFLVRRCSVSSYNLRQSLIRRIHLINFDLFENGLYPASGSNQAPQWNLNDPESITIGLFEANIVDTVNKASYAALYHLY